MSMLWHGNRYSSGPTSSAPRWTYVCVVYVTRQMFSACWQTHIGQVTRPTVWRMTQRTHYTTNEHIVLTLGSIVVGRIVLCVSIAFVGDDVDDDDNRQQRYNQMDAVQRHAHICAFRTSPHSQWQRRRRRRRPKWLYVLDTLCTRWYNNMSNSIDSSSNSSPELMWF